MAGVLQEDNGNGSTTRVMSFISLFASIVFGAATLYVAALYRVDPSTGVYLTTFFGLGAFAPKVVQKFAEQKLK